MYLHIEDPEQLHATVDRRLHDDPFALMVADATVSASVAASSYARDNRHLLEDDWVRRSVEAVARDDDNPRGLPDPYLAVIVTSQAMSSTEFAGDEWHRTVHPLPKKGGPVSEAEGICDRCDVGNLYLRELLGLEPATRKPLAIFHLARSRFIVEFRVCDECFRELTFMYGPILQVVRRGTV